MSGAAGVQILVCILFTQPPNMAAKFGGIIAASYTVFYSKQESYERFKKIQVRILRAKKEVLNHFTNIKVHQKTLNSLNFEKGRYEYEYLTLIT